MPQQLIRVPLIVLLTGLGVGAPFAFADTFGLWQYQPAEGAFSQGQAMRAWQRVEGRSFCQTVLYLPAEGGPDPRADFTADWGTFAKGRGIADPAPEPEISPAGNGWTRTEAQRNESSAQVGRYTVRQITYSGHGKRMSVVLTGNDNSVCGSKARTFLSRLVALRPSSPAEPAGPSAPSVTTSPDAFNPQRAPRITDQTWYKTAASYSHWGSSFSLPEMAKLFSGQGYARKTWRFEPDGRYHFRLEVWSLTYKPKELSGMEEIGRWRIEEDRVTVEPERAVTYVDDKASGKRLVEKPARSTPSIYRGRMHWLSGMGQWYLVLAPIDGKPTDREGDFDSQPGFPNAYFYGPPPKVGQ